MNGAIPFHDVNTKELKGADFLDVRFEVPTAANIMISLLGCDAVWFSRRIQPTWRHIPEDCGLETVKFINFSVTVRCLLYTWISSMLRSRATTIRPSLSRRRVMAAPIPELAPVTSATLPDQRNPDIAFCNKAQAVLQSGGRDVTFTCNRECGTTSYY